MGLIVEKSDLGMREPVIVSSTASKVWSDADATVAVDSSKTNRIKPQKPAIDVFRFCITLSLMGLFLL